MALSLSSKVIFGSVATVGSSATLVTWIFVVGAGGSSSSSSLLARCISAKQILANFGDAHSSILLLFFDWPNNKNYARLLGFNLGPRSVFSHFSHLIYKRTMAQWSQLTGPEVSLAFLLCIPVDIRLNALSCKAKEPALGSRWSSSSAWWHILFRLSTSSQMASLPLCLISTLSDWLLLVWENWETSARG